VEMIATPRPPSTLAGRSTSRTPAGRAGDPAQARDAPLTVRAVLQLDDEVLCESHPCSVAEAGT